MINKRVGWVKLAEVIGGPAQTDQTRIDTLSSILKPPASAGPPAAPVCSAHPTDMIEEAAAGVLWIGDSRPELAAARSCLAGLASVSIVDRVDVRSAALWLADQVVAPELIVVCQNRPGEIAHGEVDQLRRLAPLSRLIGLMGSWCEGETRSGHPWPAVERVYWHQWPAWLAHEFRMLRHDPLTATPEERWLVSNRSPAIAGNATPEYGLVAILSPRRASAEMLGDACQRRGLQAICFDRAPGHLTGAALAIWDGDRCGAAEATELQAFVAAVRPTPVVALLTFPRIEERNRALAAGVLQVFSKPLCVQQLLASIGSARIS